MQIFMSFVFSLFFACSFLQAEIVETVKFQTIQKYSTPKTLVILDIDDTLLLPVQTLGTDVWFQYRVKQNEAKEEKSVAFEKALAEWEAIRHLTKVKIVEQGTEKIIQEMQKKKFVMIGLTTQGLALATRTVQQLQSLQIDLSQTAPTKNDIVFTIGKHSVLFRHGILFTSGTDKGEALFKLLGMVGFLPEKIVFINDKATHLQDVEKTCVARGIPFVGLRYSIGDKRVASFRKDVADYQWKHSTFERILSDEEALSALR